jgi:hypothetical protein
VEDEPRSGRLVSVRESKKVDRVRAFICQDRRWTIRMITDELNECTFRQIVTQDLNVRRVCAKMVPKNLKDRQKAGRNEVSEETLERLETEPISLIGS